jgi:hypothetical protein
MKKATRMRPRIVMQCEAARATRRRQREANRNSKKAICRRGIECSVL